MKPETLLKFVVFYACLPAVWSMPANNAGDDAAAVPEEAVAAAASPEFDNQAQGLGEQVGEPLQKQGEFGSEQQQQIENADQEELTRQYEIVQQEQQQYEQQQLKLEQQLQQQLLKEQQRQQLLEEQQRQQLLEEQQRQQLLEEQQRQQLLEEQQRQHLLLQQQQQQYEQEQLQLQQQQQQQQQQVQLQQQQEQQHHQQQEQHQQEDQQQQQHHQQVEGGNVEEMVHGSRHVHDPLQQQQQPLDDNDKKNIGTVDVEHVMHGDGDAHDGAENHDPANQNLLQQKGEIKSGDIEEMVHGDGQGHVHEGDGQAGAEGPFKVAVDVLALGTFNVHDPASRDKIASAGDDVMQVMGGGGVEEMEDRGRPMVADAEHMMHGGGGHDHDVRQLKFIPSKEDKDKDKAPAKDHFSDIHKLIMHEDHDDDGDHDDDANVRRGKVITYRDIIGLGLDEQMLRGIDLTKLLKDNEREYDDWHRDKDTIKGEIAEGSFWEQIGKLRKRYLSFGHNDGSAHELTGAYLNPEEQKWVPVPSDVGFDEEDADGLEKGEDRILHDLELLGNTASKQDRHKHRHDKQEQDSSHGESSSDNGRDMADL